MRIEFGRKIDTEKTAWEHPRSSRIKHSDILFLRILIILTLLCTIYLGPVTYLLLDHSNEGVGILYELDIEEYRNKNIYKPNHILHLKIDDNWYQLMQIYSENDIRDIKQMLSSAKEKEVRIRYVNTLEKEAYLAQISYDNQDYLSCEYFEQIWKEKSITNSVHGTIIILICVLVYLFRCGFIRLYRN